MTDIGKTLIFIGGAIVLFGFFVMLIGKIPGAGKLPGDILIKKENFIPQQPQAGRDSTPLFREDKKWSFTFYFPVTTSILVSVILSLILYFFNKR